MNRNVGDPVVSSANSRLEYRVNNSRLRRLCSSVEERTQRVQPRYRQAKETMRGGMDAGRHSALLVLLKLGNSPRRTLWRKAKRRPTDSIEGNMPNTSRFDQHVHVTRLNSFGDHVDGEAVGSRNRMR